MSGEHRDQALNKLETKKNYYKVPTMRLYPMKIIMRPNTTIYNKGFTLIELSVVLVIIGLIVGGILAGKTLIRSAEVRAQITQIERYQTAVSAFKLKYTYLPGDMPESAATDARFTVMATGRSGVAGLGDGNGVIEGYCFVYCTPLGASKNTSSGEAAWFWEDLSINSGLIEGNFNTAGNGLYPEMVGAAVAKILPPAKIGNDNYVYVYSDNQQRHWFSVSCVHELDGNGAVNNMPGFECYPGLTVTQAYAIDSKIDDGNPQSGNVVARYQNWVLSGTIDYNPVWAGGRGIIGANSGAAEYGPTTAATPGSATTCYDNGNVSGAVQKYSITQNNGNSTNCALSFKFQ